MKRFEIRVKDDNSVQFAGRPSDWAQFNNILVEIKVDGIENEFSYFVKGKEVTLDEGIDAAIAEGDKAFEKKNQTHKQISWLEGFCENTRRYAWVRRS